jgi:hypothetical protein
MYVAPELAQALDARGRTWGENNEQALRRMRLRSARAIRSFEDQIREKTAARVRQPIGDGCFIRVPPPVIE